MGIFGQSIVSQHHMSLHSTTGIRDVPTMNPDSDGVSLVKRCRTKESAAQTRLLKIYIGTN